MIEPAMMTIALGQPEDLSRVLGERVRKTIGPGVFIESHQKRDMRWTYSMGMTYTEMIDDSRDDCLPTICAREVRSLFAVDVVEKEGGKYAAILPSMESIVETMNRKRNIQASKSEVVIVSKGYEKFLNLGQVSMSLNPIIKILRAVNDKQSITTKDLYHRSGKVKLEQYLSFLASIDYLKRENNAYVKGSRFDKIGGPDGDPKLNRLLAELIHSEHDYLQTYFHLTMMTPYVRLTNSYYYPSGTRGSMLRMLPELLRKYQIRYYDVRKPSNQIENQVEDMRLAKIMGKEGSYIIGDKDLFRDYCSEMPC